MAFVLVALMAGVACAANTVTMNSPSWSPNPAVVQQPITASVSSSDSAAPTAQNEDTVQAVWSYSTGTVYISSTGQAGTFTPDSGGYSIGWGPNGGDDTQSGFTFNGVFFSPGYYLVQVNVSVTYTDTTTGAVLATNTGTGYVGGDASLLSGGSGANAMAAGARPDAAGGGNGGGMPVTSVTFSSSGTTQLGLYSASHTTATLTATVTPASAVGQVSFSVTNGEASVSSTPAANAQTTGVVNLTLTAESATPSSANPQTGDAQLVATVAGKTVQGANILVLKPAAVKQPQPTGKAQTATFGGKATGVNLAAGPTTTPSYFPPKANAGDVELVTEYNIQITVQVVDQFGNNLGSLFAGTSVTETVTNGNGSNQTVPINEQLTSSGTYTDNVGGQNSPQPPTLVSAGSTQATQWPGQSGQRYALTSDFTATGTLDGPAGPFTQNFPVEVGGSTLSPGINRTYTLTPIDAYDAQISGQYNAQN